MQCTEVYIFLVFSCSFATREERRPRVFENRVLLRILGPRRDEVTGGWRKLHNEQRNNLRSSPNSLWAIKSRRMSWAEHIARMGERRGVYRVLVGEPEGKDHLEDPDIDGKIILIWIFGKWIELAQDRDRWRAFVKVVMNLRVS
jgi:hypothetical protein